MICERTVPAAVVGLVPSSSTAFGSITLTALTPKAWLATRATSVKVWPLTVAVTGLLAASKSALSFASAESRPPPLEIWAT